MLYVSSAEGLHVRAFHNTCPHTEGQLALVEREEELTVSRDMCEALRARLTEERGTAPSDLQQDLDAEQWRARSPVTSLY